MKYNLFMMLTSDQVKKVAKLAKLPLSDEQLEVYGDQLSSILEYVDKLNEVETDFIEPTFNVLELNTIEREDSVTEELTQDEALSNAPKKKDNLFVTKGVFEND